MHELGEALYMMFEIVRGEREARKHPPRWEECLRCGASHHGGRCTACGYVFRVRKQPRKLPPLGDEPSD